MAADHPERTAMLNSVESRLHLQTPDISRICAA
jgi:hypothetical protein